MRRKDKYVFYFIVGKEKKRVKSEVLTSAAEAPVYLSDADIELLLSDNKVAPLR